jgi:anhydro-N-acetylmuramic acid kinase
MSGTSLDGIDCALVRLHPNRIELVAARCMAFEPGLRADLSELMQPGPDEVHRAAIAGNALADAYADATAGLLADTGVAPGDVAAIGAHGQTVRHRPDLGYTVQLLNGARLAERTGVRVICDFRSRDVAAAGQGAPLVPAFHAFAFGSGGAGRCVVNLGGIANVTRLAVTEQVQGFDTGPANGLLDAWCARHHGTPFDADGGWAASGTADPALLAKFLDDPYFAAPPPKSTGREHFNAGWLARHLQRTERPEDVQATLAELTAASLADAVRRWCPGTRDVFLCGGGVHNRHLVARIAANLPGVRVGTSAVLGIDPDWVEAMAFAWLAYRCLVGEPGNLPAVTGAKGLRVLGAVYPA